MPHSLTGTRIREQRHHAGLSQTALARQAGISASYLNLIEHNKRRIAGKVLLAIARELDVPASSLTEGANSDLTAALIEAATHNPSQSTEASALAEFVGRFPGWSGLLASVYRQTRDQEVLISALSDRLTHDPFLAESLHLMLSSITAIRSTADILNSVDDLSAVQSSQFHSAIFEESNRLSGAAQSLTEYFDKSTQGKSEDAPKASDTDNRTMPLKQFARRAAATGYNPTTLDAEFRTGLHAIFRRLASLKSEGVEVPEMGLIITNAAGQALHRRTLPDFPLPLHGNACPLWPVFTGFSQPGHPLQDLIELPNGTQFVTLTVALPRAETPFGTPPDYQSAMLFLPREQSLWPPISQPARKVGISCRICPRENCAARSEKTVL